MTLKTLKQLLGMILIPLLMITACSQQEATASVEDDAVSFEDFGNIVSASGKVMPVQWATMSFETSGRLVWLVAEGSQVATGDELARLETDDLEHAVVQARAALATAEAELNLTRAGAKPEDVAAAEAAVVAAQGSVAAAEATLSQAEINADSARAVERSESSIAAAEASLAQAQASAEIARAELSKAFAELARLQAGTRPEEIARYQYLVNQAQSDFLYYENIHFSEFIDRDIGGGPEERARYQRESARNARDAIQAQLDMARAGSTTEEISAAAAVVNAARAQVDFAEAGVAAAEAALAEAQATPETTQAQVALADSEIAAAQAQVAIAQGELAQAEAQRDALIAGAMAEELAVLEAQVAQAQVALIQAEAALSKATLLAPFAGTVGIVQLKSGESVIPGMGVLVLGDVSVLRVETSDLNEVDAIQVDMESPVTLTFDALPGGTTEGDIVRIAPMASAGQGGTNFTAIIDMVSPPETLRWGMTAFVDIEVN